MVAAPPPRSTEGSGMLAPGALDLGIPSILPSGELPSGSLNRELVVEILKELLISQSVRKCVC